MHGGSSLADYQMVGQASKWEATTHPKNYTYDYPIKVVEKEKCQKEW